MKTVIIKYNAGNIKSVSCALDRMGANYSVSANKREIENADRVIFPGVGEASTAMRYLKEEKLDILIKNLQQPFLGICLGLQLMCSHSEENNTECLNIFPVETKLFPRKPSFKIPHMGWNSVEGDMINKENPWFYFVHSYYVPVSSFTTGICNYDGIDFSAILEKDNFVGFQFHPEKSGKEGEALLRRFLC